MERGTFADVAVVGATEARPVRSPGGMEPRDPALLQVMHQVGAEPIVEWRALTVVLLDRIADLVRAGLGLTSADFPLAKILEGGTWSAGRRLARERRPGGASPIRLDSDGTVF